MNCHLNISRSVKTALGIAMVGVLPFFAQAAETIRLSTYVNETDVRYEASRNLPNLPSRKVTAS